MSAVRRFDEAVERLADRLRCRPLDPMFYGLSSAADHGLLWLALGAVRAARAGDPTIAVRFAIALGTESALTNGPIKFAFRRLRPVHDVDEPLPYGLHRPITSAFPSGHATSGFTAASLLGHGSRAKPAYFALAGLVAFSRVYVRLHHASDVAAGSLLGLAFGRIAVRSGLAVPSEPVEATP